MCCLQGTLNVDDAVTFHDFVPGDPLQVEINMQVRSMGPISEVDMVRSQTTLTNSVRINYVM